MGKEENWHMSILTLQHKGESE